MRVGSMLGLLVLTSCGSAAPLLDPRPPTWALAPTRAEAITLRSHYDSASPYRECVTMRADVTMREAGEEITRPMRVGLTSRVEARAVGETFEVVSDFDAALAEGQLTAGVADGERVAHVDARNRPIDPLPAVPETPNTEVGEFTAFRLPTWPQFGMLSPQWPEGALEPGATFVEVRRPVRRGAGVPTSLGRVTVRWTYLGLTDDRREARLRCEGTFDWRFSGVRPDGAHMEGASEGRFGCEVAIDVETGVLGHGHLVAESTSWTDGGDTAEVHARTSHETRLTIDTIAIAADASDPICEGAASVAD